jgi:hypothetical protein
MIDPAYKTELATAETLCDKKRMRHCWHCGAEMGVIENRYYDRGDTCGKRECDRAARDVAQEERDEAHKQLERDMEWGW